MEVLLTFLIITYRRPEKVVRLLQSFLDDNWNEFDISDFEIVIADDHSEDNTLEIISPTIEALQNKGWLVRYVYRDENLRGDRNLYYGYAKDSIGKFVWFLCDDDMINVKEAINYLKVVFQTNPLVSICGFEQGDKNQYGNKFEGEARLINSFSESVDYLIKFPKTTAYLMRRCPEIDLDPLFEELDRTLFSWIGLAIYLLGTNNQDKLFIYPSIVAKADEEYSLLPYSYRIFGTMSFVTERSIEFADLSFKLIKPQLYNLKYEDEILLNLTGLRAHYSWRTTIKYTPTILEQEWSFFKTNWLKCFGSPIRFTSLLKFLIYFIISKNVFRR